MSDREAWLTRAVTKIEVSVFWPMELKMPEKWAVTCGWAKGASAQAIGTCVDPICSKDGTTHMFVVPTQENGMSVLGTLVHEMVHAIVGVKEGHRRPFLDLAKKLQMSKPATRSHPVPETPLWAKLQEILEALGPYPHAAMVPRKKPSKPQDWARWKSKKEPKYTVLVNTKKVAEFGIPRDPWGFEMTPVDPGKIFGLKLDPRQRELFELPKGDLPVNEDGSD
jgi:hypothetical protein